MRPVVNIKRMGGQPCEPGGKLTLLLALARFAASELAGLAGLISLLVNLRIVLDPGRDAPVAKGAMPRAPCGPIP